MSSCSLTNPPRIELNTNIKNTVALAPSHDDIPCSLENGDLSSLDDGSEDDCTPKTVWASRKSLDIVNLYCAQGGQVKRLRSGSFLSVYLDEDLIQLSSSHVSIGRGNRDPTDKDSLQASFLMTTAKIGVKKNTIGCGRNEGSGDGVGDNRTESVMAEVTSETGVIDSGGGEGEDLYGDISISEPDMEIEVQAKVVKDVKDENLLATAPLEVDSMFFSRRVLFRPRFGSSRKKLLNVSRTGIPVGIDTDHGKARTMAPLLVSLLANLHGSRQ